MAHAMMDDDRCGLLLTTGFSHLQATAELAATYAALILADDGIEITVRRTSIL